MERPSLRKKPRRPRAAIVWLLGWLLVGGLAGPLRAAAYAPPHIFIGPEAVLTLEIINATDVMVNVINLSDYAVLFEPKNLVFKSKSGKVSIGQVIDMPETDNLGNTWKFRAKLLIAPRTSQGFTVRGAFQELKSVDSVYVKIGGRRFYGAAISEVEFNLLADKITNMDLQSTNFPKLFDQLQIPTKGTIRSAVGPEAGEDETRGMISAEGANPPKIIIKPATQPTEAARKAGVHGVVKVSGLVTRDGEFINTKVSKDLGYGLGERALETVRNSWRFLPATREGEVVDATVTVNVEFP